MTDNIPLELFLIQDRQHSQQQNLQWPIMKHDAGLSDIKNKVSEQVCIGHTSLVILVTVWWSVVSRWYKSKSLKHSGKDRPSALNVQLKNSKAVMTNIELVYHCGHHELS